MEIVLDEWIYHYISNPRKRETIFQFLENVLRKCDRFVTIRGKGLDQKIWAMAKKSSYWDDTGRKLVKWFMGSFRFNTKKFYVLEESNATALPAELEQETPSADRYLVQAAITTGGFILTTDTKLKENLSNRPEVTVCIVDEFLDHYDP